jgi:hypothetical protein
MPSVPKLYRLEGVLTLGQVSGDVSELPTNPFPVLPGPKNEGPASQPPNVPLDPKQRLLSNPAVFEDDLASIERFRTVLHLFTAAEAFVSLKAAPLAGISLGDIVTREELFILRRRIFFNVEEQALIGLQTGTLVPEDIAKLPGFSLVGAKDFAAVAVESEMTARVLAETLQGAKTQELFWELKFNFAEREALEGGTVQPFAGIENVAKSLALTLENRLELKFNLTTLLGRAPTPEELQRVIRGTPPAALLPPKQVWISDPSLVPPPDPLG